MKNTFNPSQWLPVKNSTGKPSGPEAALKASKTAPGGTRTRTDAENRQAVERALDAIQASGIDLTPSYKSWLEIGFSFADAFGESGREYFQRVSQFHPEYNRQDCNKKYDHCLKSTGSGITLSSFFHHLRAASPEMFQHAVSPQLPPPLPGSEESFWDSHEPARDFSEALPTSAFSDRNKEEAMTPEAAAPPSFPDELFPKLPELLQQAVALADNKQERDILLLGSLGVLSACFPNAVGLYKGMRVGTNFYLFVTAPASAGKGRLNLCRRLVTPLHKLKQEEGRAAKAEYDRRLAEYNMNKAGERPVPPPLKMLIIPANNSSTGMFQLLADNEGQGLLFETEADTLGQNLKKDFGDYSDLLRKAWHHETISYYRRTDREYVDIDFPCLSVVLSGTPRQVPNLIPGSENGLFSRFMFYYMNVEAEWEDVWMEGSEKDIQEHYDNLGAQFFRFHKHLQQREKIRVHLGPGQHRRFNEFFSETLKWYKVVHGPDYVATVKRLGVMCYRMAMLLSLLRLKEGDPVPSNLYCSDEDYEIAIQLVKCLNSHSGLIFRILPEQMPIKLRSEHNEEFLKSLPQEFSRSEYQAIAKGLGMETKAADRAMDRARKAKIVESVSWGHYARKQG